MITSQMQRAWVALMSIQRQCWEQGIASQVALRLGKTDEAICMAHDCVTRQGSDGRLALIECTIAIVDPAASGAAVKAALEHTGDEKYQIALEKMTHYLLFDAPRSPEGAMYQLSDRNHVWVDSLGMAPPYLAMPGYADEAMIHAKAVIQLLWNKEKHLFSHMYDSDQNRFEREAFWTAGNGWALFGLVHTMLYLDETRAEDKAYLMRFYLDLIESMRSYQLPDGLMHDVIDDPDTFVETNGAQMYAYAVYMGIASGWLPVEYKESADAVLTAARAKVDAYGFVQDAGGSPDFCKPGTSAEAQSFYLLMEAAAQML